MIFYIAIKDIRNFFYKEKKVFIWLIICLVLTSFALNFSYSFARYRGQRYEMAKGSEKSLIIIDCGIIDGEYVENIIESINKSNFPKIQEKHFFARDNSGHIIAGVSEISPKLSELTGVWVEGYADKIDSTEKFACAIKEELLSYDGRLKMTGEEYYIDGIKYIIRGVYEEGNHADIVIHDTSFSEQFKSTNGFEIRFARKLSNSEEKKLCELISEKLSGASAHISDTDESEAVINSNQLQYTVFIVMLVFLISYILRYWHNVNISTYTIYWMEGAKKKTVALIVLCEVIILCMSTYITGLALNSIVRLFIKESASLVSRDLLTGFLVFFVTMAFLSVYNMIELINNFSIKNIKEN